VRTGTSAAPIGDQPSAQTSGPENRTGAGGLRDSDPAQALSAITESTSLIWL
jgi:hypothetical protein